MNASVILKNCRRKYHILDALHLWVMLFFFPYGDSCGPCKRHVARGHHVADPWVRLPARETDSRVGCPAGSDMQDLHWRRQWACRWQVAPVWCWAAMVTCRGTVQRHRRASGQETTVWKGKESGCKGLWKTLARSQVFTLDDSFCSPL